MADTLLLFGVEIWQLFQCLVCAGAEGKKKCTAPGQEFMLVLTGGGSWLSRNVSSEKWREQKGL